MGPGIDIEGPGRSARPVVAIWRGQPTDRSAPADRVPCRTTRLREGIGRTGCICRGPCSQQANAKHTYARPGDETARRPCKSASTSNPTTVTLLASSSHVTETEGKRRAAGGARPTVNGVAERVERCRVLDGLDRQLPDLALGVGRERHPLDLNDPRQDEKK